MTSTHPIGADEGSGASAPEPRVLTAADHARWGFVVRRTAMRVARRAPDGFEVEQLCRRGFLGLLDGLRQADAMAPDLREAYIEQRIRLAMIDHVRAARPEVVAARRASRDLARYLRRCTEAGAPHVDEEAIAAGLGLDPVAYEDLLLRVADAGIARIDVLELDDDAAETRSFLPPRTTLAHCIEELPLRERNVLALLFGEELSIDEVAVVLGTSARRVLCLLTQTVHRLRAALGKE